MCTQEIVRYKMEISQLIESIENAANQVDIDKYFGLKTQLYYACDSLYLRLDKAALKSIHESLVNSKQTAITTIMTTTLARYYKVY